jgi:hypothetical protein
MATMIKEEKYTVYVGTEEYVLRVQELLWGLEPWPERFRAQIPASAEGNATMVYGSTGREAAERATEYLSYFSGARTWLSHARAC